MNTVIIKAINSMYLLSVDDWLWIREHRNEPLRVFKIYRTSNGCVRAISIYKNSKDIITVYPTGNDLRCQIIE